MSRSLKGDSAGHDIRSFNPDGTDRHIEVKTTAGPASNAFFISPNEIEFISKHPSSYVLMRLYGYSQATNSANFYEKLGPISDWFGLTHPPNIAPGCSPPLMAAMSGRQRIEAL